MLALRQIKLHSQMMHQASEPSSGVFESALDSAADTADKRHAIKIGRIEMHLSVEGHPHARAKAAEQGAANTDATPSAVFSRAQRIVARLAPKIRTTSTGINTV